MSTYRIEVEFSTGRWDVARTLKTDDIDDVIRLANDIADMQGRAVQVIRLQETVFIKRPVKP